MATTFTASVDVISLHADDDVCVAARSLPVGTRIGVNGREVELRSPIPYAHKIALRAIASGGRVHKYGQTIGFATRDIAPGDWIHTHNLTAGEFARDYAYASETPPDPQPITGRTFMGYRRPDGKAGTRNYIAVISSVNCSATVCKFVARHFNADMIKAYPNVDGIIPITHPGGCAVQSGGEDHQQLMRVISGFARHANIGGYVLIGLGCETNSVTNLMRNGNMVQLGRSAQDIPILTMQEQGGTVKTVAAGVKAVASLLPRVNDIRRVAIPASEIILGVECGGSDGNSGITANPALGVASDMLVAAGGTSVLSETPEVYGAEHLLTRRAVSEAVGRKLVDRILWWERYTAFFGATMDNNLAAGNKEGGMTTIYEKSLGAVAKGGSMALREVYRYAEPVTTKGFVFMDTPGYDPASVTGLVAGGCNVICFTTGRGSCFGCKPTPSIKIATNTPMYERIIDDMDLNAGVIYAGTTVQEVGRQIFDMVLDVASGNKTRSEVHGIGEEEIVPWSIGPTL